MKKKNVGEIKFKVIIALVVLSVLVYPLTADAQKPAGKRIVLIEKTYNKFETDNVQIFTRVNAERARNGLKHLLWDDDVADIARDYSEKMARENFFSHFDAKGNSVLERAQSARLKHWSKIGENLFSIVNLEKFDAFTVKHWMKSPTHRQNILNPEWTATGIGIAQSNEGEIFITQVFIKR